MSKHNETGTKGEQLAEKFLSDKGYIILSRNWFHGKKEVDLIAQKDGMIVMVEVKTRGSMYFGFPEEFVNGRKQSFLKEAAEAWMEQNPQFRLVRFDIISIHLEKDIIKEIVHFEDAFY